MISRENLTREALSQMESRRAENRRTERARLQTAREKSQLLVELLSRREALFRDGVRGAFSDPARAKEISGRMRAEIESLSAAIRKELVRVGLPEDYLQPVYTCPQCKDTGYVGEPVHEICGCVRRAVMSQLYANDGLQRLERENFASFDESVFPDTPIEGRKSTQRGYMRRARAFCEEYADTFAADDGVGLLLWGRSGLGKTYMMNCVAQRILERGFSVVLISAYRLIETMRRYQFEGADAETVQDLLSCDLLCIDDLGSEPMLRQVTVSSLYHIINERRSANRALLTTTNCSIDQLYERYDDRVAARLTDPSRMRTIEFIGTDVRAFLQGAGRR